VSPPLTGQYLAPERFIELALRSGSQGISISFNEPILSLEWSLDVFQLARECGLYSSYVTNGYMTPEALSLLIDAGLDAMNIDVKGDPDTVRKLCKMVDVERVWAISTMARSHGIHLEITTLVIPTVNDSDATLREIAERMALELGKDVPWHLTGYSPAYKFSVPPTTVPALEHAWEIGKAAGLHFVYVGNVGSHPCSDTYCPECRSLLIRRSGLEVEQNLLKNGRCPRCSGQVAGVW
jgi:pyruvate formate lyase activating enzyme